MPRDTKAPAEKLSPSAFMRQLRPEIYSDTIDRTTYQLDAPTLGYHLETITARNQTHDFEIFCRKLCQRAICPNLKPATGPEGGGDSKADTETISIADEIGVLTYVGDANAGRERWAFAFSAKKKWAEKVRKDVAAIVATARGYHKIYCVTAQFARAKDRARVEDEARHLRGPRVLCDGTGKPLTQKVVQVLVRRTARRANVRPGIHILRHTFCSHLAMRGAPARAIQELAGHQDLGTTQRYMHLTPAALDAAIRLLETGTDTSRVAVEK